VNRASYFICSVIWRSGEVAVSRQQYAMRKGLLFISLAVLAGPLSVRAADDFPQGCVSCHVVMEDKADKRLGPMLAEIGHVSIKGKVVSVPADCVACHTEKSDTKFAVLIHQSHFASPTDNVFVQHFGGDCRHCHVMDGSTGEAGLKTGKANW
jgi:hypothetical protein